MPLSEQSEPTIQMVDLYLLDKIRRNAGAEGLACYVAMLNMTRATSCVVDFMSAKKATKLKQAALVETIEKLNNLRVSNWRFPRQLTEDGRLVRRNGTPLKAMAAP